MTTKERLQRVVLARRLFANGVPLHIDRDDEDAGLRVRQIGAETESCIFDLRDGRSGCMVNMRITITQGGFAIADIALELPWTDPALSLIDDPLKSGARYGRYWFPNNLSFERTAVINHFANVCRQRRRGETMEGLLLWVGSEPIPDAFVHGVSIPASVIVRDQYDNSHASEVTLWADRSERGTRDEHKTKTKPRPRLFSRRDLSPVDSGSGGGHG